MQDAKAGVTATNAAATATATAMRSELVSFDMPALASTSPGRFSGQVAMPNQLQKEALDLLMGTMTCKGVGVAVWPSKGGAILYAGEILGKQMNGMGLVEFPSARSSWSMAAGKFEKGAFSFGRATAGDALDFVGEIWQKFILSNIQAKTSWTASEFKGQWKGGFPSQGITVLPDGSMHVGSWKDGKFHDACLFVDAEGHWVKGHFHQGNLFGVTFRSQTKCKLPPECEHLLAKAEVADIPAEVLQGEYKSFVDTADKLARDGMEVSKLARSVSNIAYLKSAQVLGLPAHAVESSLNSLAHLVDHENRKGKGKAQQANLSTALTALAQNLSPQQGSALNQGQHHQQQALREQLVLLMKNKQIDGATAAAALQGTIPRSKYLDPNTLTYNSLSQGLRAQQSAQVKPGQTSTQGLAGTSISPVNPMQPSDLGATNPDPTGAEQHVAAKNLGEKGIPCNWVGLLFVNPPVMSRPTPDGYKRIATGEENIEIEGCCKSRDELQDISILCISGNKYVRCETVLKNLHTSPNIYSNGVPMTTFTVSFSFRPETVGITHFLFASKTSQQPFSLEQSIGPCKAQLAFGEKQKNYHVLPLVVLDNDRVCEEIVGSFKKYKYDLLAFQRHYKKCAEYLQALGAFVADKEDNKEESLKKLMLTSSELRLPITLQHLHELGTSGGNGVKNDKNDDGDRDTITDDETEELGAAEETQSLKKKAESVPLP